MTGIDTVPRSGKNSQRLIELAIPVISFGATFAGVLLWQAGFAIGFQYFAIGCVIGSCLLAYLAWIRPRKDIVALSTPIYAFIFFVVPTDYSSGLVLQLLYSASLVLLTVRLKYRFGTLTTPVSNTSLGGELASYVSRVEGAFSAVSAEQARITGEVFVQFARAEYREAAKLSREARVLLGGTDGAALSRALEIAGEQAVLLEKGVDAPATFIAFLPEHAPLLAKENLPGVDRVRQSQTVLDNALLLIFAAAYTGSPKNRDLLRSFEGFAAKLLAE